MQIKEIPIAALNPAAYNPRKMTPARYRSLLDSLTEFGMVDPVVVNKGKTIGGHGKKLADDYIQTLKAFHCPTLLNNKTGMMLEELYEEMVYEGAVQEAPIEFPDSEAWIIELMPEDE